MHDILAASTIFGSNLVIEKEVKRSFTILYVFDKLHDVQ